MKFFPDDAGYDSAPFKFEVHGVGDPAGRWTSNAVRYDTFEAAEEAAKNLADRWFGMDDWRVVKAQPETA